jgi:hypothetical protein
MDHSSTAASVPAQLVLLLAGCAPLIGVAADNPRGAEYLCPATNEAVDPARLRLPESMAAPAQQALAGELAYFRAEHGLGVFGPRGWSCRSWTGSSGKLLLVTPKPLPPPYFPLPAISGPAVLMQTTDGTDVGRFHLALVAERLFPLLGRDIIDRVRQEHLIADASFDTEPYPDDRVEDLSDRLVEYTTAGGHSGLGTDTLLEPNDQPIRGLTTLNPEVLTDALTEFRIRLGAPMAPVEEAIIELETRCLQLSRGCRELGD